MSSFTKSTSFNRRALSSLSVESPRSTSSTAFNSPIGSAFASPRTFGGSPRPYTNRLKEISYLFQVLIVAGTLVSFLVIIAGGYLYVVPSLGYNGALQFNDTSVTINSKECDIFVGNWVVDDSYPLYNASECPFVERGFNCLGNGRGHDEYLKWRWKPKHCNVPRFQVRDVLERLRGKRIVFVGDSMSRTQWESLICMLMTGLDDKRSVYEVNGNNITKRIRFLGVRFSSFNFTVEFYRSVFLVQPGKLLRWHAPKRVKSTLKLDVLDVINNEWSSADYLVFNTGQWWVPGKLFETGCYFQVGNSLRLGMSIPSAYRVALETWASWIETKIDPNKTRVLFRTFEPSHWSDHRSCNVTKYPTPDTQGRDRSIFSEMIKEVVKNMTVPVSVLDVTSMSAFRSDGHVGLWSDNPLVPDCSHWCLPGVPDIWNEILLFFLFRQQVTFSLFAFLI
ncbi:hypothetical protein HID58_079422 [Brassica napus]|uniref:Uncharacterized protein n=2 Tax=Brassica TaxID=3705 RepID=A0A3P6F8L2_BRAOL|nr:hypothetical protein HID58_079422 [Brassica napus]CAF2106021.1 unnamed protein product [Brassica napus]VDD54037.1 unnamed protein product [Brassica oleracea]